MTTELKDVFGKPNEGIHAHRLFGVAIVDVAATFVLAAIIKMNSQYSFWVISAALFVAAIVIHRLVGVETALNKRIFG